MSKVKVKANIKGLIELRNSKEIQDFLQTCANDIVSRCSGSYETNTYTGKTRANASIITRDSATYHRNLKTNELLKALGS